MSNYSIWVVAHEADAAAELVSGALCLSSNVNAVTFGGEAVAKAAQAQGALTVLSVNAIDTPATDVSAMGTPATDVSAVGTSGPDNTLKNCLPENHSKALAKLLQERNSKLTIFSATATGRLMAGMVASHLGTSAYNAASITINDDTPVITSMVYGGCAIATRRLLSSQAVITVGAGVLGAVLPESQEPQASALSAALPESQEPQASALSSALPEAAESELALSEPQASGSIEQIDLSVNDNAAVVLEVKPRKTESVNLAAAKRVIGVGRGFAAKEDLELAFNLASKLDAELACSRPITESENWMARERYIGVSGVVVKPELYIALGISGQIQHMVGVNQAKTIIAINKDKNAPVFKQADYGIVGDIYEVLPVLTSALS
ncbi:MAG: electron transfer flavoprotein subunit alpha/FixB family protein [Coriobacteriales bacterium]|jgi:electron transfer flavoprotein alpha subunit|nr:electron transfer flavoprotein subunit alpha/FixB family protein [Coriobacteriales bacterium]